MISGMGTDGTDIFLNIKQGYCENIRYNRESLLKTNEYR